MQQSVTTAIYWIPGCKIFYSLPMVRQENLTPGMTRAEHLSKKKQGFTLLELAIVMVIISLLIGGVIVGNKLVEQSQLRSIIAEVNFYNTSLDVFKLQYNALPGDFPNASSIWPTCDGTPSNCNGNDDGRIDYGTNPGYGVGSGNGTTQNEAWRAWQQLAASGIIDGSYTGIGTTSYQSDIGVNIPASKLSGAGYSIFYWGSGTAGNCFNFGGFAAGATNLAAVLTASQSYKIDLKIDDGYPRAGIVWGAGGGNCFALSGGTNVYTVTVTTISCAMLFIFRPY